MTLTINAAPTGGHVDASPRAGVAAVDTFVLESLDWTDEVDDLPLLFSFSYNNEVLLWKLIQLLLLQYRDWPFDDHAMDKKLEPNEVSARCPARIPHIMKADNA